MRLKTLFIIFNLLTINLLFAQVAYINEVLHIVENNALYRDSVDFEKVRAEVFKQVENANTSKDSYPAVRYILSQLKDNHSFLMEEKDVKAWKTHIISQDNNKATLPFSGKLLDKGIGYLQMDGFNSGDSLSIIKYAEALQDLIKSIDQPQLIGWIIDLRRNTGGNCWPMITGLGPLIGEGTCGYFVDYDQNKYSWYYKAGEAGVNNKAISKITKAPYRLVKEENPIAVLTGPWTGSSGEVKVTCFRGKANSKSFGTPTAGLSTGNEMFTLSDGAAIFLTTSVYADRLGITYGRKIEPDFTTESEQEQMPVNLDPVIIAASQWIKNYKRE